MMFQIFEQCFTPKELEQLHDDMQTLKNQQLQQQGTEETQYRDYTTLRWRLIKSSETDILVTKIVSRCLPTHRIGFLAYSEQTQPSRLHCDSYGGPYGATCIIPLKDYGENNDQTLVFNKYSKDGQNQTDIEQELQQEMLTSRPKNKNSILYRLEHVIDNKKIPNPCNWMELVGVFPYKYGNMVAFDKRLLHCSNNWFATDATRKHKDFIIIHTYTV